MDIELKIFWGIWIFIEILMIVDRSSRSDLGFYLACLIVQVGAWFILSSNFEMELLRENGWIVILVGGALLWFGLPLLKREIARGDSGGFTIVEEEM